MVPLTAHEARAQFESRTIEQAQSVLIEDLGWDWNVSNLARDEVAIGSNNVVIPLREPFRKVGRTPTAFPDLEGVPPSLRNKPVDGWVAKVLRDDHIPGVVNRDTEILPELTDLFSKRIKLVERHVVTTRAGKRVIFERSAPGKHPADVIQELFGTALKKTEDIKEQRDRASTLLGALMDTRLSECFTPKSNFLKYLESRASHCQSLVNKGIDIAEVAKRAKDYHWIELKRSLDELKRVAQGAESAFHGNLERLQRLKGVNKQYPMRNKMFFTPHDAENAYTDIDTIDASIDNFKIEPTSKGLYPYVLHLYDF